MRGLFKSIVDEINKVYRYVKDEDLHDKEEFWTDLVDIDGELLGDCEDYCITIANRCLRQGMPLDQLTLHLVRIRGTKFYHILLEHNGWYADCNKLTLTRRPNYVRVSKRNLAEKNWVKA